MEIAISARRGADAMQLSWLLLLAVPGPIAELAGGDKIHGVHGKSV